MNRAALYWVLMSLLGLACSGDTERTPLVAEQPSLPLRQASTGPKVIILVIDGPRNQETFSDLSHAHIPNMATVLKPQGTLITNFWNNGRTYTTSGHASSLTGNWQFIDNDGGERPDTPTLFEYFRSGESAPQSDALLLAGKPKLSACAYSTHPSYGSAFGPTEIIGFENDRQTYNALITALQTDQPRLVMASFQSVDQKGHGGSWDDYVLAIEEAASLAGELWAFRQNDSYYAGQTYLFITTDDGRHDDANGGFQHHGDICNGCRQSFLLALGPEIKQDTVVPYYYTLRDICKTTAGILGFETPEAGGGFIVDIFVPVVTGIKESSSE